MDNVEVVNPTGVFEDIDDFNKDMSALKVLWKKNYFLKFALLEV